MNCLFGNVIINFIANKEKERDLNYFKHLKNTFICQKQNRKVIGHKSFSVSGIVGNILYDFVLLVFIYEILQSFLCLYHFKLSHIF